MNTMKIPLLALVFAFFLNAGFAQSIVLRNTVCTTAVCPAANPITFGLSRLRFNPSGPAADPRQRFEAFWVPGDGNYLLFNPSDPVQDALSLAPTYGYSAAGDYEATSYLTGKYTNHTPPPRMAQGVTINAPAPPTSITPFRKRLKIANDTVPMIDIFSNHEIRKNNLTTFVISWPGDVNATGIYLFFDGYKNSRTGEYAILSDTALTYQNTDVPAYFAGIIPGTQQPFLDASQIGAYKTTDLGSPIHDVTFTQPFFNEITNRFRQMVFIPAETAKKVDMPSGFTENRLFVVLRANSTFVPQDTFMNFVVMLAGPTSQSGNDALQQTLSGIFDDLSASTPITSIHQQPQYVQAIDELQLEYLTTFDPNELRVQDVRKIGADEYEVTFQLEMCNKGRENVLSEKINLSFSSDFHHFEPAGFNPIDSDLRTNSWDFRLNLFIGGVTPNPGGYEESTCESILFKAKTNCQGLRSLWKSGQPTPVQSCVLFEGGLAGTLPECHSATAIDSTQFGCMCCTGNGHIVNNSDASCWPLWLLLILVVLFAIWWVYKRNND